MKIVTFAAIKGGVGKTLWQANYRIVDSLRKDMLLDKLMSQNKNIMTVKSVLRKQKSGY